MFETLKIGEESDYFSLVDGEKLEVGGAGSVRMRLLGSTGHTLHSVRSKVLKRRGLIMHERTKEEIVASSNWS